MDLEFAYLAGIILFTFLSAFFSFSETALTALSGMRAEQLVSEGGWFKSSLRHWIKMPERLLSTILVCNTFVNAQIAVLTTNYIDTLFSDEAVSDAWIGLGVTVILVIFGEITPKVVARAHSELAAPYVCRFILVFDAILYPITTGLTVTMKTLLGFVGISTSEKITITHSDIEYMVSMVGRQDRFEQDKTKILSSVIQFSKRRVKDIMVPREKVSAIRIDSTLPEVLEIVKTENHSRYPVYNQNLDRILGFLHARDLFAIVNKVIQSNLEAPPIEKFSLRTCLRRAFFVSEQAMISRVLNEMKSNRIHLAIVKDEWGNVVGLVTLEDILEEVFGEINDEHDDLNARPIVDLYSTGVEVEGTELLVDLKSKYGIEIEPTDSYSTVNGFLMHYAVHQQLTVKTVIIWNNYVFSILEVKEGEVARVRLTEIPGDTERS